MSARCAKGALLRKLTWLPRKVAQGLKALCVQLPQENCSQTVAYFYIWWHTTVRELALKMFDAQWGTVRFHTSWELYTLRVMRKVYINHLWSLRPQVWRPHTPFTESCMKCFHVVAHVFQLRLHIKERCIPSSFFHNDMDRLCRDSTLVAKPSFALSV